MGDDNARGVVVKRGKNHLSFHARATSSPRSVGSAATEVTEASRSARFRRAISADSTALKYTSKNFSAFEASFNAAFKRL